MKGPEKACAVPYRHGHGGAIELLAFRHPFAGCQLVKGNIEEGEHPVDAAIRELREESGIQMSATPRVLGQTAMGDPPLRWHFVAFAADSLSETWSFHTADDGGHVFHFFCYRRDGEIGDDWHPMVRPALAFLRSLGSAGLR